MSKKTTKDLDAEIMAAALEDAQLTIPELDILEKYSFDELNAAFDTFVSTEAKLKLRRGDTVKGTFQGVTFEYSTDQYEKDYKGGKNVNYGRTLVSYQFKIRKGQLNYTITRKLGYAVDIIHHEEKAYNSFVNYITDITCGLATQFDIKLESLLGVSPTKLPDILNKNIGKQMEVSYMAFGKKTVEDDKGNTREEPVGYLLEFIPEYIHRNDKKEAANG